MDQQLTEISTKLDNLTTFIQKNMVTKEELADLRHELPSRTDFSQLQTSVDGIARQYKDTQDELKITAERTTRIEKWVLQAAAKIGVEYKP
ncbi:MAG: hypothetical protein ACR2H4_19680 [Pyrinomonadaceae bacterium]